MILEFEEKKKHLQFALWLYMWCFFIDNNGFVFNIYESVVILVMMLTLVATMKADLQGQRRES